MAFTLYRDRGLHCPRNERSHCQRYPGMLYLSTLAGGLSLSSRCALCWALFLMLVALSGRVVVSGVGQWLGAVLVVCSIGGWSSSQCLYPIMATCLG